MPKKEKWKMPPWMNAYKGLINNTGGNEVTELMNDHTTNVVVNAPRAMICVAVKSQVSLLEVLHDKGHLAETSLAGKLVLAWRVFVAMEAHYENDRTTQSRNKLDRAKAEFARLVQEAEKAVDLTLK